ERHRTRAQGGACDSQAPAHELVAIDSGLGPTQQGNDDDTAIVGQAVDVAVDIFAGNHVQHDVHAPAIGGFLDLFHIVLRTVIDAKDCAEPFHGTDAFVTTHGGIHLVA